MNHPRRFHFLFGSSAPFLLGSRYLMSRGGTKGAMLPPFILSLFEPRDRRTTGGMGGGDSGQKDPITSSIDNLPKLKDFNLTDWVPTIDWEQLKDTVKSFAGRTLDLLSKLWTQIRSWWDELKWPDLFGGHDSADQPVHFGTKLNSEQQYRVDYARIAQILISLVGIALSLALMWRLIEQINPTAKEKRSARNRAHETLAQLGVKYIPYLNDYEVGIAVNLVDTRILSTDWDSIGGLHSVIDDLKESVIHPFQLSQQFNRLPSKLLRPPKGVLFFGPPGCGKTMLARAMAREANAYFINLQIATLVNMWYGETQKYVEATFSLAHKLQPSIIFIDELDSFLTTRSTTDNESTRMIKTQFMALWDGLLTEEHTRILIVGATNRPWDLDLAILRRLPYKIAVPLPDAMQRVHIISLCLGWEPLTELLTESDVQSIAAKTDGLSGSDLNELCREAAFCCYRQEQGKVNLEEMRLRPCHFEQALQKFLQNRIHTQQLISGNSPTL